MPDENLVSGLSAQIERVGAKAQRWRDMMAEHPDMFAGMKLGLHVMEGELKRARDALKGGDIMEMLPALKSLQDYSDDD